MVKYYDGEMYIIPKKFEEEIRADERKKINFAEQYYNHPWLDNHEEEIRAEVRADISKECKYLLNCGMGKKKSLEHLIKILEKEQKGKDINVRSKNLKNCKGAGK